MLNLPTSVSFGIRSALMISIILTIVKFIIGGISGSLAIIGSALDSLLDIFVSGVNVVALWLSRKAGTRTFAYGLGKVQGFAAIFEGLVVLSSGVFLGWNGYKNFLAHKTPEVSGVEMGAMLLAMIGTGLIMWNFFRIAKVNNSLLIRSDALHYSTDLYMNGGILLALLATRYFDWWWADAVFAIAIAFWIIWHALPIVWSGITMLLDRALSEDEIKEVEKILKSDVAIEDFHYLKTRKSGDDVFIEAHIVFRDKNISLHDAHTISESIESALGARFLGAQITLHLDTDAEPEVCEIKDKK